MSRDTEISAEFPFESKYTTVHGSRMHYVDEGSGDPIVGEASDQGMVKLSEERTVRHAHSVTRESTPT